VCVSFVEEKKGTAGLGEGGEGKLRANKTGRDLGSAIGQQDGRLKNGGGGGIL